MPALSKKRVIKWAKRQARARDVLVVKYRDANYLEPYLQRVLQAMQIEVFLDVGANRGQTVEELRTGGFSGHIVSFEPTPHLFDGLVERFGADARWTGHQLALGSAAGELELHRYEEESLNSFLLPNEFGAARFTKLAAAPVGSVSVPVRRLDEAWDEVVPDGRVFLKVDTQGFDVEVLRGAAGVIDRVSAIVTEVPINQIYEGMPAFEETFELMASSGFELSGLFPVTRDKVGVRLVEANCVFVRSAAFAGGQ